MKTVLDDLLIQCLQMEVTDLHFKSYHRPIIMVRQYGRMIELKKMSLQLYHLLFTYIEYQASINLNLKAKPQTGSFKRELKNHMYYFRLSYLPCVDDYAMVLRILNHEHTIQFSDLTNNLQILNDFRLLLEKKYGLVIVCGATGSGKSTTLHAFLDEIYKQNEKNIICIEDPIEIFNKHYVQIQISDDLGYDEVLKQVLRHDPDIVMIGEIRDAITASMAIRMALTGHLVLTTLHASNCHIALRRMLHFNIDENDLKELLMGVIHQELFYQSNHALVQFEYYIEPSINQLYETN